MKNPLTFIAESFQEMKHVVWPTPRESKRYLTFTVSIIIAMTLYLSLLGFTFRESFAAIRSTLNPHSNRTNTHDFATHQDLEKVKNIYEQFNVKNPHTGTTLSGNIHTGSTSINPIQPSLKGSHK